MKESLGRKTKMRGIENRCEKVPRECILIDTWLLKMKK